MKNKLISLYLVVSIIVTILLVIYFITINSNFNKKPIIGTVNKVNFTPQLSYTGVVESSKLYPLYIETEGIVEEVFVKEGSYVKQGEPLVKFSQSSLFNLNKLLKINELDINEVLLKLENLEYGTSKLELDTKSLETKNIEDQMRATNRKIPILTSEADALRKRANALYSLFEQGGISAIEANKSSTEASKKEAELEDLKMNLELLKQKYNLTFLGYESLKRDIKMQKMQFNSTLSKLNLAKNELLQKSKELQEPLKSPISGIVVKIDISPGSNISAGSRLFSIAEQGNKIIVIKVPLSELSFISNNENIQVFYSEKSSTPIIGKLQRISNIANSTGNTSERVVDVEILIPPDSSLNIGFNATVLITAPERQDILVVDSKSIFFESTHAFILIYEKDEIKKFPVKLGKIAGNNIEILNLPQGQKYVINHEDFQSAKNKYINK
ncbi:MAG: efflux RND transporter periplasmic adaptor subunit [Fusobacteriaceae bacterium]